MLVPPMIKAVLSGGGTSEDDADADDTGATVAITTALRRRSTPSSAWRCAENS